MGASEKNGSLVSVWGTGSLGGVSRHHWCDAEIFLISLWEWFTYAFGVMPKAGARLNIFLHSYCFWLSYLTWMKDTYIKMLEVDYSNFFSIHHLQVSLFRLVQVSNLMRRLYIVLEVLTGMCILRLRFTFYCCAVIVWDFSLQCQIFPGATSVLLNFTCRKLKLWLLLFEDRNFIAWKRF